MHPQSLVICIKTLNANFQRVLFYGFPFLPFDNLKYFAADFNLHSPIPKFSFLLIKTYNNEKYISRPPPVYRNTFCPGKNLHE
jgi:hypothetical protein